MPAHAGPARRTGRPSGLYVTFWGLLAFAAVTYMGMLAVKPHTTSRLFAGVAHGTAAEPSQSQQAMQHAMARVDDLSRSLSDLRADVGTVRQALATHEDHANEVAELQVEVSDIKTALAGQDERQRALSVRMAAVEEQQSNQKIASAPAPVARSDAGGIVTGSVEDRDGVPLKAQPKKPSKEPAHVEVKPKQQVAAAPVASFGTAKVVSHAGPVGLQLATGASPDALRLSWLRLNSGHKDALQRFEPHYSQIRGGATPLYRLLVGPITNTQEASRVCTEFRSAKMSCSVVAFSGQPL